MLAGGLHIGNIADAVATSGAKHLDVSSGVESQPGVKDHAAIAAFVLAAEKQDAPDLHKQG
jgi:phosphoribosylanthranilate isomerase